MDPSLFEAVWREHYRGLIAYCSYSTGSRTDGEEIAAEVFSQLLESRRAIDPGRVGAWLFAVARNMCASHHRRATRQRRLTVRLVPPDHAAAASDVWKDEHLWAAVRALNERGRLAVYLRVFEGRPFIEIAELMGVSESAAKMTYYRAMKRVRDAVSEVSAEELRSDSGGVTDAE